MEYSHYNNKHKDKMPKNTKKLSKMSKSQGWWRDWGGDR